MARIAGIDLPRNKRIEIGLTYIYGIGLPTANKILETAGVNPDRRVHELNDDEVNRLRRIIERQLQADAALRPDVSINLQRFTQLAACRHVYARTRLPVRSMTSHARS